MLHAVESPALRRHIDDSVRAWLGVRADVDVPALPEELARLVMRVEELEHSHRDRFGCWEFGYSENYRRGALWTPEVDRWAAAQRERVGSEPLWPHGHTFAVALTHDVDMVSRDSTPAQVLRAARRKLLSVGSASGRERVLRLVLADGQPSYWGIARTPSTEDSLERCMAIEKEYGVRASYFFAAYPGPHSSRYDCVYELDDPCRFHDRTATIGAVVRELASMGHEIGVHGSYASSLDADLLAGERRALESAAGQTLTTTRQHLLRWDARDTPRAQAAAGLTVDASLGFNRNVGFRAGTALPFRPFDFVENEPVDVLELPLVLQEGALFLPDALALDTTLARAVSAQLVDAVAEVGGVATILFHPHSLAGQDYVDLYRAVIDHALERGAWVAPLGEIARWWRERERTLGLDILEP
jgi:hypothetical protein